MNGNYSYQSIPTRNAVQVPDRQMPMLYQTNQQQSPQVQSQKPIIFGDFDPTSQATLPFEKVEASEHTFVIDSRQRDCTRYPSPSYYRVELPAVYRNITSIELRGSVIPRSSYNVHNANKYIDFSIGSTITKIVLKNAGTNYTNPVITIGAPESGVQATATATTNTFGQITSISIGVSGSGYRTATPPYISITDAGGTGSGADAYAIVGILYTAELRVGQYIIGGNPTPPDDVPSGLINEIQNAMNYAVNGNPYDPTSTSPFEVRLVNQYPELDATVGTPEYYNTNSASFNRIQITNVNSDHWELLFCSGVHRKCNSSILMGFNNVDYYEPVTTLAVDYGTIGTLISAGATLRATNDYDLLDDPKYVVLSFWEGSESFERIESKENSLNRKFGTMVFDANASNVITDTTGTSFTSGSSSYLVGPVTKGDFWTAPGVLKPIRGFDFDQKKLEFTPPIGKLSSLYIRFNVFSGLQENPEQELYDFSGRNHLLIFSVKANDNKSGRKN
jgi:hypothetical protein